MRPSPAGLAAAGLVGALVTLVPVAPVRAAPAGCAEVVVDTAAVLGTGVDRVTRAAAEVTALGAEVRVRVWPRPNGTDLDSSVEAEATRCGWRDAAGRPRPELLVVAVTVTDRGTGIYYGSRWKPALDAGWRDIQTRTMNPRFAAGDLAGGLTAGLTEVAARIAAAPARSGSAESGSVPADDARPTGPGADTGRSESGNQVGFLAVVGLLACVGMNCVFGLVWYLATGSLRGARRAATTAAAAADTARSALAGALDELTAATAGLSGHRPGVRVDEVLAAAVTASAGASDAARRYEETARVCPPAGLGRLPATAAGIATARWVDARARLDAAAGAVRVATATGLGATRAIDELPGTLAGLDRRRVAVGETLDRLRAEGWQVHGLAAELDPVPAEVDRARALLAAGTTGAALDAADAAAARLASVEKQAGGLPARRDAITRQVAELRSRLPRALADLGAARTGLAALRRGYHPSDSADLSVPDDPPATLLDQAVAAVDPAIQDWAAAEAVCAGAGAALDAATAARVAVDARASELARLARTVPGALAEAERAVAAAEARLRAYRAVLPASFEAEARVMRPGLAEERRLAAGPVPPLLRLGHSLAQLVTYANALAGRAEAVHRRAVAARYPTFHPGASTFDSSWAGSLGSSFDSGSSGSSGSSFDSGSSGSSGSSFDSGSSGSSGSSFDSGSSSSSSSSFDGGSSSW